MNFSAGISPQVFLLLAETNVRESKEFMNEYIFSSGTLLMIRSFVFYIFLSVFLEFTWRRLNNLRLSSVLCVILSGSVFILLIIGQFSFSRFLKLVDISSSDKAGSWYNQKKYQPHNKVTKLVYSAYVLSLVADEVKQALNNTLAVGANACTDVDGSLNVVVVIGESYIKSHCQLYGYSLSTSPFLFEERKKDNLYVFNDVISPFNDTSASMKNMLSCNSLSLNEFWYTKPIFPAIFKKAGFEVSFWDNQKEFVPEAVAALTLTSFLYNDKIVKISYDRTNDWINQYDLDFIDSTGEYKLSSDRNLIIYHLMGQHVDAKERYPINGKWNFFTVDSIHRDDSYLSLKKKQEIAEYDNATRYNDYVLMRIIQRYRHQNSVLVYFSDHGEEIYDYRNHKGRDLSGANITYNYMKYQHEIPFMIWCSDKFKESFPQVIGEIKNSLSKPFMTDNLPHLLFHLAKIKTEYYKESKDLLSPSYNCGRRMVHDCDYDKIRDN